MVEQESPSVTEGFELAVVHGKKVREPKPDSIRFKIWDLARQGKNAKEIASTIQRPSNYVSTELRFLRLANLLPHGLEPRPPASTEVERRVHLRGGLAARGERPLMTTCPRCQTRFEVLE